MKTPVAIVEDDADLCENIASLIARSKSLKFLSAFSSGEEALARLPALLPAVVVMDINLPGISGVECTRLLKSVLPETQVLMLTMFDDAESIFGALRAGASGYLLKRSAPAGLVEAIQQAAEGGAPMSPQIARKVVQFFRSPGAGSADDDGLTDRERELLSLLARGDQYKEIADQLSISMDTVRSHIRRIYKKLHVHSRTEATVRFLGRRT